MYQPLPFRWNVVEEMSFDTLPRHVGHFVSGLSLIRCIVSKSPHFAQRYS
jgi:hypothetical protein